MTQRAQRQAKGSGTGARVVARENAPRETALTLEARDVLHALFCLSRDTRHISATTLGEAVALTPTQTGAALVLLEQRGLVDASRARLTMTGLVLAMQAGSATGGPRKSGRNAQERKIERALSELPGIELPIAALPSQPPPAPPSSPSVETSTFDELRLELY